MGKRRPKEANGDLWKQSAWPKGGRDEQLGSKRRPKAVQGSEKNFDYFGENNGLGASWAPDGLRERQVGQMGSKWEGEIVEGRRKSTPRGARGPKMEPS